MLFLIFLCFPKRITDMQQRHGLEYSQLSRLMKCAWLHIYVNWGRLVTNNFAFFVPRMAAYCQAIQDTFAASNQAWSWTPSMLMQPSSPTGQSADITKTLGTSASIASATWSQ